MLEHTIRVHMRKTIYLICHFLKANFMFYRLVRFILSCQILLFFYLKMMTWSHRNVETLCPIRFACFRQRGQQLKQIHLPKVSVASTKLLLSFLCS